MRTLPTAASFRECQRNNASTRGGIPTFCQCEAKRSPMRALRLENLDTSQQHEMITNANPSR